MKANNKKLVIEFKGEDQVIAYEGLKLLAAREGLHLEDFCLGVLVIFGDQTLKFLEEKLKKEEEVDGSRDEV